jgi:hypothetical protein
MANKDDCRYQCQEEGAEMSNIPAFPAMHFDLAEREHGMSLRDYFAAKALQGLMHNYHPCEFLEDKNYLEDISMASYQIANAMMKARDA